MMLFSNSTPYVWSQGLLLNPWLTHWQDWLSSHSKHLHVYLHLSLVVKLLVLNLGNCYLTHSHRKLCQAFPLRVFIVTFCPFCFWIYFYEFVHPTRNQI